MIAWRAAGAIAWIELVRMSRLRMSATLLFLVPAFQIILFGTAIRPTETHIGVAIAGPLSAESLIAALGDVEGLRVDGNLRAPGLAARAVADHHAKFGIEFPGTGGDVRIIVDAADPAATALVESRLQAAYWRKLANAAPGGLAPPLHIERLYNPDMRPDWGFLPALIGVIMMISAIMFGTLALAREREQGTWETLLVLPVGRLTMTLGKIAPYTLLGTCQGLVTLAVAAWLFDLPIRGSVVMLVALMPVFAAAHLALGLAIAARSQTQIGALQGAIAFYLPCMLLSGFLFPLEALPRWARAVSQVLPLTHFIRAARLATLQGGSAAMVAAQGLPILLFLAGATGLAGLSYRHSRN